MPGVDNVVARDLESAGVPPSSPGLRSTAHALSGFCERTFHGLTLRRLAVLAAFGLALSLFNWPVAIAYGRGLPVSQIALAFVLTYLATVVWFFAGLTAAVAAWNRTRGGLALRLCVTAVALGVTVWMVTPMPLVKQIAPVREVVRAQGPGHAFLWMDHVVIVALAAAALLYITRSDDMQRLLETEALRALDLDRALDEARLQAAQAQIEPHFLFNTLANVRRLYEVDREDARTMLRQFSHMLGRSLADIRISRSTLGREVALALAYLSVQKIRMGDRLEIATDIPPSLADAALPPMMLPTLVENAIKHGLAPLPAGGRVVIAAHAEDNVLQVRVVDNGRGMSEGSGSGVGLANIATRLTALFDSAGELNLEPNEHGGVTACLQLPLRFEAADASDAGAAA